MLGQSDVICDLLEDAPLKVIMVSIIRRESLPVRFRGSTETLSTLWFTNLALFIEDMRRL